MLAGNFPSNFELVVMLTILELPGMSYGANLRRRIEAETEQEVTYGSLYVALDRLEEKGWLRSVLGPPSVDRKGRPRKIYHFTNEGLERFGKTGVILQPLLDSEAYHDWH